MTEISECTRSLGPTSSTHRAVILLGLRLVLGGVLMVAGATKIGEPTLFASLIDDYRVLPPGWSVHLAVSLPWVEVLVGCCLVVGLWTRSSALVAAGMFGAFVGAMAINVYRGADLSCGCFGVGEGDGEGTLWVSLLRSAVLLVVAVGLLLQRCEARWSMDNLLWVSPDAPKKVLANHAQNVGHQQAMVSTS